MVENPLSAKLCLKTKISETFRDPSFRKALFYTLLVSAFVFLGMNESFAQNVPGTDESGKLEGLGTLLKMTDTIMFSWGTKILSAVCIVAAGWSLKEQRIPVAILCIVGAIFLALSGTIVKNAFEVGGGGTIFNSAKVEVKQFNRGYDHTLLRVG